MAYTMFNSLVLGEVTNQMTACNTLTGADLSNKKQLWNTMSLTPLSTSDSYAKASSVKYWTPDTVSGGSSQYETTRLPIPAEIRNSGPVNTIKIKVEIFEGWTFGLFLINNYVNNIRHI